MHTVEKASEKIQSLILEAKMPADIAEIIEQEFQKLDAEFVAVRSSATAEDGAEAAWAGQLNSYLNTTQSDLLRNVQKCWASLFTPRAIFYRFEKGLHRTKISVAVVVQKMIQSEKSGIAFSVHPVTEHYNQLIIEAGYGLGEAIVSGSVTPDSYVVEKEPRNILDINVATQTKALYGKDGGGNEWRDILEPQASSQVLDEKEILELSALIIKIENHYGFPCDIEWAEEGGKFYITQSRPITTLKGIQDPANLIDKFTELIGGQNIMSFDSAILPFAIIIDWLAFYDRSGKLHEINPLMLHRTKNGLTKGYLNDEQYCFAAEEGLIAYLNDNQYINSIEKQYLKNTKEIENEHDSYFGNSRNDAEEQLFELFKSVHVSLVEMVKLTLTIERLDKGIAKKIISKEVDLNKVWKISELSIFESFDTRNSRNILEVLEKKQDQELLRYIYTSYTFLPSKEEALVQISKIKPAQLQKQIEESENFVVLNRKKREKMTQDLSGKERELLAYLDWVMTTRDYRKIFISKATILLADLGEKLFSIWGIDPKLLPYISVLELVRGREYVLGNIERIKARSGNCTLLYLGKDEEIQQSTEDVTKSLAQLDEIIIKQHTEGNGEVLTGETGSAGKAIGRANIIIAESEFSKFKSGDILIAPMTRPEYLPLMRKASAIVTDEGGITCHAAIVSRELGVPCVIGTKIATKIIKDGDLVEVDADSGVVRVLERAENEEYFKFKFPAYRYFMTNRLIPTVKFQDFYLWGEIFGEYSPEGMHKTFTNKRVFLNPGRKLFKLLQNGNEELENELVSIISEVRQLANKLQEILYQDGLQNHVSSLDVFFVEYEKIFNKALAFGYPLDYAIDEYVKANPKITDLLKSPYSSFLAEEEYELYEIFSKAHDASELEDALKKHLAKYAWIRSDYQGENIFTLDDLYAKQDQLLAVRPAKIKSLKEKITSPKDLQEWISLLIYLRDMRKKMGMIGVVLLDRYLKEECRKHKKDYTKARMLTIEEFESNKNSMLPKCPDGRRERIAPEGRVLFTKEEWQKYSFNQEEEIKEKKVLSGVVANKGVIRGKARVIIGKHDFHKMQKDDVVVASMTRPEFMLILKKASAILTEQGGITCHAAIISRELNVPCIIGIENLTNIIRDGDLVEVDADNGIVRILNK